MSEYSEILSHNVLDGATLTGNGIAGHEEERLRDGNRHTWWEAPSTDSEYIYIECKNLIVNPDFEIDISGWLGYALGAGGGSVARNTVSPIAGVGDLEVVVTTANDTTDQVYLFATKKIYMLAGRTYRISLVANVASNKQARIGFMPSLGVEEVGAYGLVTFTTTDDGFKYDFTPTTSGWYHPYVRFIELETYHLDSFQCGEVRDVDTLIIDKGHTLAWGAIAVGYRDARTSGYSNALATSLVYDDGSVYKTFAGVKALSWRITVAPSVAISGVPVIQMPLLFLGKRWTLPHYFSGGFDPHQNDLKTDDVISDRGIIRRAHKYNQRVFRASMNHISASEYENVKLFFEDTENGLRPFCFLWKPASDPTDMLILRLAGGRNAPYMNGALRTWVFDAAEVVGQRVI